MNHHSNIANPQNNPSFVQQPGSQIRTGLHIQHGNMQQQQISQPQQIPQSQTMPLRHNYNPIQPGPSVRLPAQQQPQQIRKVAPQQQQGAEQQKLFQDPVIALKQLLPEMRQSLVTLMQAASQNFSKNLVADDSKTNFNSTSLPRYYIVYIIYIFFYFNSRNYIIFCF